MGRTAILHAVMGRLFPVWWKERVELHFWRERVREEQVLSHGHYKRAFTETFNLEEADFTGKRILDIGCGPRGSLEWADMAAERVGLDPLAKEYLKLGATQHAMTYVDAPSENIPFPDRHFDIVSSFNSLDHVEDLGRTISEIKRVVKPGGIFLLATDVNHDPTPCEPQVISWDVVSRFEPEFEQTRIQQVEKRGKGMYDSLAQNIAYDHDDPTKRYGILIALLTRKS